MSYAKGRGYEYKFVWHVNKKYGKHMRAERVLLSGQRGEGDVVITLPLDDSDGLVLNAEVKARKEVPKTVYEWLGKHDLLVMKKIGRQYGWVVALDLDRFLGLLAQLPRTPRTSDNAPKSVREDEDSVIL
jgi:hypothetical protein